MEAPRRTAAGGRGQERCTVYAGCVLGGPERAQRIGLSKLFLDCPRAAQADEIDPHRQTRSTRTGRRDRGRLRSRPSRSIARVLLPTSRDSERGRPAPRDGEHGSRSAVRKAARRLDVCIYDAVRGPGTRRGARRPDPTVPLEVFVGPIGPKEDAVHERRCAMHLLARCKGRCRSTGAIPAGPMESLPGRLQLP